MLESIEMEVQQSRSVLCAWVNQLFEQLWDGGPDWANPFSRELLFDALQRYVRSIRIDRDNSTNLLYSNWVKGDCNNFVPVAFSSVPVWSEDRHKSLALAAVAAASSLREYQRVEQPITLSVDDLRLDKVAETIQNDLRIYHQVGGRFTMFGGILSVESFVHLIQERTRVVLPGIYNSLGWNYQRGGFSVSRYLKGDSEEDIEHAFMLHWRDYIKTLRQTNGIEVP